MFPFPTALEGSIGIWSSWCIHIPSSMDWTRQTMDLWSVSDSTSSAPLWQLLTTLFPLLELDWWTFTSRLDGCKDRNTLGVEDGWKMPCTHLPGVEVTKKNFGTIRLLGGKIKRTSSPSVSHLSMSLRRCIDGLGSLRKKASPQCKWYTHMASMASPSTSRILSYNIWTSPLFTQK